MKKVPLGKTGLAVSRIGFGSFKIGRNEGIKYPQSYELPDDETCRKLLEGVLDLGIDLIDTAPAYGSSEMRIGTLLGSRRDSFVLSTKVGERFVHGRSQYEFSAAAFRASLHESLQRLQTSYVDVLLIHANADDVALQTQTDAVAGLQALKREGLARCIGISPKTLAGAQAALVWADVLMLEYHLQDRTFERFIESASQAGKGILIKKGLGAGSLNPNEALPFLLQNPHVASIVVGSLKLEHLRQHVALAGKY